MWQGLTDQLTQLTQLTRWFFAAGTVEATSGASGMRNEEQCRAAMGEFGFDVVDLDKPGAPTPGRIADRLSDISGSLDKALAAGSLPAVVEAAAELRRLLRALDAYDGGMMRKAGA
jgi:hypothetical protein